MSLALVCQVTCEWYCNSASGGREPDSRLILSIFSSLVHAASPGSDIDLDDIHSQLRVLSLLGNLATVVAAAAARDADTIRNYLTRNPQDVSLSVDLHSLYHNNIIVIVKRFYVIVNACTECSTRFTA